jgi:DNA adenine methylase
VAGSYYADGGGVVSVLRAPFPWFGGKSRAAGIVWDAFGNVPNYVEPFFGSGAVLLCRPHRGKTETVNDRDCYLANFWRSIAAAPDEVARHADWPVNEADIEARHRWLVAQSGFRERMMREADYLDPKVAGWWVWGLCGWIGSGWCAAAGVPVDDSNAGRGVHRQLPHLGNAGQGVHRKLPHLGDAGERLGPLTDYFAQLATRLRGVRVACGDWSRVLGDSVTWRHGTTGILLDPPYDDGEVTYAAGGTGVAAQVADWCREHGSDARLRIALCGYEGDHALPGWSVAAWKAKGGYGSQRTDGTTNDNAGRERVWLSPGCVSGALSEPLFAGVSA